MSVGAAVGAPAAPGHHDRRRRDAVSRGQIAAIGPWSTPLADILDTWRKVAAAAKLGRPCGNGQGAVTLASPQSHFLALRFVGGKHSLVTVIAMDRQTK